MFHGVKDDVLVVWVLVGAKLQVDGGIDWFMVYIMTQKPQVSCKYQYLGMDDDHLFPSPYFLKDTLQLFKRAHQFLQAMGPGNKGVIHVQKLAEGLRDCPVKRHLLK